MLDRSERLDTLAGKYATRRGRPVLSYIVGKGWILMSDWHVAVNDSELLILAGFEFDLASVPRIFWPLIAPFDCSIEAPLAHDFVYRYHDTGGKVWKRWEVDRLFRDLMRQEQVPGWKAWFAWTAVRLFGWWAWHQSPRLANPAVTAASQKP